VEGEILIILVFLVRLRLRCLGVLSLKFCPDPTNELTCLEIASRNPQHGRGITLTCKFIAATAFF
jgi:hypothetical protein